MGLPLGGITDAEAVAEIPPDTPVRMEIDVANNSYRYVALTPEELKQRAEDAAVAEAQAAKAKIAEDERDALAAKLVDDKATDAEVQQALARLLSPIVGL